MTPAEIEAELRRRAAMARAINHSTHEDGLRLIMGVRDAALTEAADLVRDHLKERGE